MSDRCGYAVTDADGIEEPCDRPVTGWRWYQDCGHEPCLEAACIWHENDGGQRVYEITAERERACNIAVALEAQLAAIETLLVVEYDTAADETYGTNARRRPIAQDEILKILDGCP